MATSTAGAWQSGARPERPYPARAPRPSAAADRPMRSNSRSGVPGPGRSGDRVRPTERDRVRDRYEPSAPVQRSAGRPHPADRATDRSAEHSMASPRAGAPAARDSKLRGFLALGAVFLLTLAGCAVDSFVGSGLGLITLVTLTASTAAAVLLVRRRDLLTVIVAPPLVFAAVAAVNVAMAPSATLNLPTMATLLVRGFPTMAAATIAAIVLAVFRMAARR